MAVVWSFIVVTTFWAFNLLWLFGPDSSFQIFPPFVIIIFFFASYNSIVGKAVFMLLTVAVYQGMSYFYGERTPVIELSVSAHRCLRDSCMFIIIFCTCIAAHIFSKDSLAMEKKLVEYNKRLKEKANTDPLTGLHNRGMAMEYLQDFVKKADQMICSICICDIDHFKNVNDTYGHDAGDRVVKAVAKALKSSVGDEAFVARWGGEEFFLAFPDQNGDEALTILYDIQSELRKTVVMSGDQKIKVTLTYGLTEYDKNQPLDQNIKDADNKLYMGKDQGRDRIMY
jgi:diguanylate cyclase (GGDEF)-like protein